MLFTSMPSILFQRLSPGLRALPWLFLAALAPEARGQEQPESELSEPAGEAVALADEYPAADASSGTLWLPSMRVSARRGWGRLSRSDEAVGTYRLSVSEMERSVSSFDDPSRMVQTLPGVGRGNDWETALIVRGGAPNQTGFLLDGIPVSRVSHYEGMRNDHGGVGLLNMTFADGIDFHNGAFAAHLPDRMSGMVEVRYRDGDTAQNRTRLFADVIGAGAATEGPIALEGRSGSYAGVFRYSAMDLLIRSGVLEAFGTPRYYNGQARVYLPAGESAFRLNLVGGGDHWYNGIGDHAVLDLNGGFLAGGASWENKDGAVLTRADASFERRSQAEEFRNLRRQSVPGTDSLSRNETGSEDRYRLSADRSFPLGGRWKLRSGISGNLVVGRYRLDYADEGTYIPEADTTVDYNGSARLYPRPFPEAAAYSEATWISASEAWESYAGYRHFYEGASDRHGFGPRLGVKFRPARILALKGGLGLHTQPHDYMELAQRPDPMRARLPYTAQAVAGWEWYLPAGVLFSMEAFGKESYRLARRRMVLEDGNPAPVYLDTGRARSRGGEVYLRKPRGGLFGFSAAYNFLWHRELDARGEWRKSAYSIPHSCNVSAEARIVKGLYLGGRYSIASGAPYIPFDSAASMEAGTGVYDLARAYSVSERRFSRLDARIHWDLAVKKASLSVFAEVENVFARRNHFARSWNLLEGGEIIMQGMGRVPSAGISMAF